MVGSKKAVRPRLRRLWVLLGALALALAVAVPVALATFDDVDPSNPFYADINAIQGAGVTQGCGGGNFCPTDNITRQAEAAFVHRVAPRVAQGGSGTVGRIVPSGGVDLGDLTISVGGVAGGTQFVTLTATVDTAILSMAGCPCLTTYGMNQDGVGYLTFDYTMNDALPAAGGPETAGWDTSSSSVVVAVPTASTQTFHTYAFLLGGTGTVYGFGLLSAITAPFGSSGASTLNQQTQGQSTATIPAMPKGKSRLPAAR